MKVYLVVYHLQPDSLQALAISATLLQQAAIRLHPFATAWLLRGFQSAGEVQQLLLPFIGEQTGLLITELGPQTVWAGFGEGVDAWLSTTAG